jgi:hypothetical protein
MLLVFAQRNLVHLVTVTKQSLGIRFWDAVDKPFIPRFLQVLSRQARVQSVQFWFKDILVLTLFNPNLFVTVNHHRMPARQQNPSQDRQQ